MPYLILNNLDLIIGCVAAVVVGWFTPGLVARLFSIRIKPRLPKLQWATNKPSVPKAFFARVSDPLNIPAEPDPVRPYLADAIETLLSIRQKDNPSLPAVLGALRSMNAYAFEELVVICLRERQMDGFAPRGYSRDGGVDAWGFWRGRAVVVQAKRWRRHICNQDIAALADLAENVAGIGLFVHTGRTGKKARRQALRRRVNVLSGGDLVAFVLGREFSMRWVVPEVPEAFDQPLPPYVRQLQLSAG